MLCSCSDSAVIVHTQQGCNASVTLSCRKLPEKFGKLLAEDQLKQIEELGLLADLDDQVSLVLNA